MLTMKNKIAQMVPEVDPDYNFGPKEGVIGVNRLWEVIGVSCGVLWEVVLQETVGNGVVWVLAGTWRVAGMVSNDDAAMAQRWLKDKQPEEKTNMDCLVKERENVHLGIKVGANITVTGVPGQKGAEGNVAEKKKGVYES
ncbi:hypothetical protein Tco_0890865 [Tanacetum coccineum]|uniref:Uncharacterized protein n=1 Tax=Tanacetum coccineum TaxID=301880 RepID=A0ABQ5C4Q7_9ASTR